MSSLIVASPSDSFELRIHRALFAMSDGADEHRRYWREGLLDEDLDQVVKELTSTDPQVIALGPGLDVETALDVARSVDADRPDIVVVLVAEPSIELLERALRAGARDVISPAAPDDALREAFGRAFEAGSRRRSTIASPEATVPERHVIVTLSPKGGTGKTTVSSNLALGLAQRTPGDVVIVDLDLQFGDVFSALHIAPEHTFADLVRSAPTLEVTALKTFLTAHPSGLYALCAPADPADADAITPEMVHRVLTLLATEFRHVVIDTPAGLDETTLAALELCTDIVCLTSTDVPSVRNTRKSVETLDRIGFTTQRRHFVVNRSDAKVGLNLRDIEQTVGLDIDHAIPSSRAVAMAVNQGQPILLGDPRNPVSVALSGLVDRFVAPPQACGPAAAVAAKRRRRSR